MQVLKKALRFLLALPILLLALLASGPAGADNSVGHACGKFGLFEHHAKQCRPEIAGFCTGGRYEGLRCDSAAEILLCREGGGSCTLRPLAGDGGTQHAIPSCKTVDGKCECKCVGLTAIGIAICQNFMDNFCKASGMCRCDSTGTCTFPSPCQ